jgi:acyl-coenzyme A thioesterase PaaI-like protein
VILPVVDTGPEALLRMSELTVEDGVYAGWMPVGPWLAVRRRTPAGALAVLVDDLLGYAITEELPSGRWSVSTEITLDLLRALPTAGRVFVKARQTYSDAQGGFASGTVKDESGRLLAVCTQRGRVIRAPEGLVEEGAWGGPPRPGDLERLLAVRADAPMPTTDVLANEADHLHGGVSLFASDLVASALAPELVTASIHIAYARGIPIGSEVVWRASVRHPGRSLTVVDVDGVVDDVVSTTARIVLHPPPAGDE